MKACAKKSAATSSECLEAGARIGVNGERERRIWAPVCYVTLHYSHKVV